MVDAVQHSVYGFAELDLHAAMLRADRTGEQVHAEKPINVCFTR
jgi:hypothetical protein